MDLTAGSLKCCRNNISFVAPQMKHALKMSQSQYGLAVGEPLRYSKQIW